MSGELDSVHTTATGIPLPQLYGIVRQQAMMVSMKEIFGWLVLLSLACLGVFILKGSSLRMGNIIHPKFSTIRKLIKHELRLDRIFVTRRLFSVGRKLWLLVIISVGIVLPLYVEMYN